METSPVRYVKKTQKKTKCSWCWEPIEKGAPSRTWLTYGENVSVRMHPECFEAMQKADLYDEELPVPGTFRRGCWCGESEKHCSCNDPAIKKGEAGNA